MCAVTVAGSLFPTEELKVPNIEFAISDCNHNCTSIASNTADCCTGIAAKC